MATRRDERYYRAWMMHHHVSRRGLLRGLLGGGARARQQAVLAPLHRAVGRPPHALSEPEFLACCIGCSACVTACPYGLIVPSEEGVWLDIAFCACDTAHCQLCADACLYGALQSRLPPDTGWRPQVSLQCLGRHTDCRLCQQACPHQALYFDGDGQPQVEGQRCDGCGQCKVACHHGHVQLQGTVPRGR